MMRTTAASRLLPIAMVVFGLLAACGRQPAPARQEPTVSAKDEIDEVNALIEATKQNPSVANPAKAGPPIHVNLPASSTANQQRAAK